MPEPIRVLVVVAGPSHGASDRVRLSDLVGPLGEVGVELREWVQPHLVVPSWWVGDPTEALDAGLASADDLAAVLWADVIWIRRFGGSFLTVPEGAEPRPSGFEDLLRAIVARPALLYGRRIVYDIDADLLEPRIGTRAAAARAERAQVELLLELADIVTVATAVLRDALVRRVPSDRIRLVPNAVDVAAYRPATRDPGRVPVVAAIDVRDGPGGLADWIAELTRGRRDGLGFHAVRLADSEASEIAGFDEVVRADEGGAGWPQALARIAPDIVLAPLHGDRFGRAASALTWLEATSVGAATLADGRAPGPYAGLVDGRDARLVDGPKGVISALAELLGSANRREALAVGALERLLAADTNQRRAGEWATAFHAAVDLPARSAATRPAGWRARRDARRLAIAQAGDPIDEHAKSGEVDSLALVGVIPPDAATLGAAFDAARRAVPPPIEIILAGDADAIAAVASLAKEGPTTWAGTVRWVSVSPEATAGDALAAAISATTAAWVGVLDASAELRPSGLAELIGVIRENNLDAAFGELVVPGHRGVVYRIGGWPPTPATFRATTLVVAGEAARRSVTPATAELDDPVLDWLLALMEAGCRTGSAGVTVAREIPRAARLTRIRSVGPGVPYADGGEDRLLGIIGSASDRGSTSDELADSITDWTSRYHLSRLRGNIVDSIAFPVGARVIDVGAGTGTIARALGERGLDVVALEGSFDRARLAAVRCADLPTVEVIHGTVGDYENPRDFDAVVVVGVLEYSGSFQGGAAGPNAFLGRLRGLLRPKGVLVIAIENRLGLKYLQGCAEDHLGRPWVGIDGYGGSGGVRTWSRRALRSLLEEAGFPHQRWRYPFPDYKLPTRVIDEAAYQELDAATLVDALVREPIHDYAYARTLVRDDRGAHQGFLDAGLGEDIANSFLVIASSDEPSLERFAPSGGPLAWLYGDERVSRWSRRRTVERSATGRVIRLQGSPSAVVEGSLRQVRETEEAFVPGRTLEQELKTALADQGLIGATRILGDWVAAIEREAAQSADVAGGAPRPDRPKEAAHARAALTPFAPLRGHPGLPGALLDLVPSNFIRTADGPIVRVDREWQLASPIDRNIALYRALWYVAGMMVRTAWTTPWPANWSIRQLAHELAMAAGVADDDAHFKRFRAAESWLQARVLGGDHARGQGTNQRPRA